MSPNFQEAAAIAQREAKKAHEVNPDFFNNQRLLIGVEKVGGSTFLLTKKTIPDTFYFRVVETPNGISVESADKDVKSFT